MTGFDPPSRGTNSARYGEAAPKLLAWTDREKRRRDLRPPGAPRTMADATAPRLARL